MSDNDRYNTNADGEVISDLRVRNLMSDETPGGANRAEHDPRFQENGNAHGAAINSLRDL